MLFSFTVADHDDSIKSNQETATLPLFALAMIFFETPNNLSTREYCFSAGNNSSSSIHIHRHLHAVILKVALLVCTSRKDD